jgi:hypothetical protein
VLLLLLASAKEGLFYRLQLLLAKYLVFTPLMIKTIVRIETGRDCSRKNGSGSY